VRRTWICIFIYIYIYIYKFFKIMVLIETYLDNYNSEIDKNKYF